MVATAAAMAAIMVATAVAAMVAAMAAAIEVAATAAATAAAIMVAIAMAIIALTLIILLEQKVGKIEAMEILLITLNMKMVGAGEKGECPMRVILQMRQIRNPFLQVLSLT